MKLSNKESKICEEKLESELYDSFQYSENKNGKTSADIVNEFFIKNFNLMEVEMVDDICILIEKSIEKLAKDIVKRRYPKLIGQK